MRIHNRPIKNSNFNFFKKPLDEYNGIVGFGGDLKPQNLISAYSKGIFPWFNEDEPILWYNPPQRMIITDESLKFSNRLKRKMKNFSFKINTIFSNVIGTCATIKRKGQKGTWINNQMIDAYIQLHQLKYASSIEVYQNKQLIGGLYGVHLKDIFFGESMFSKISDGSKMALCFLLTQTRYKILDCQIENEHLKKLGGYCISRQQFLQMLKLAL